MTDKIPPMPSRWPGTIEEWVAHRQAGNDAVQKYWRQLAQTPSAIETDEHGNPIVTVTIDPNSGMAEEAPPSAVQRLFSKKP
jgi:hypothetical protein